jgi:hypothetical protein
MRVISILQNTAFYAGGMAETTRGRQNNWTNWEKYVTPLGINPYLQDMLFPWRVRALTGFDIRVCRGAFAKGHHI